ncbi:MAG: FAD-dependent monooxygenase [Bryobacteraceae bacterium]
MISVRIIGAGPAGTAAALAALSAGARVIVYEQSGFPRHKVCGEFLSPEIAPILEQLGATAAFRERRPARVERVTLHFGKAAKRWRLSEPGFGLSRYALDDLLLQHALARGTELIQGRAEPDNQPTVVAHGRKQAASGTRLFGFKAHFQGPCDDEVSLFFFAGCYAGVSPVENGATNVCGVAPEDVLQTCGFDVDALLERSEMLRERVRPLSRSTNWLFSGPLVFRENFSGLTEPHLYLAGDALGFVDPFTGSGVLAALLTGRLAGTAAARGLSSADHMRECRGKLYFQYQLAALFRRAVATGLADRLVPLVPGRLLFWVTRPKVSV